MFQHCTKLQDVDVSATALAEAMLSLGVKPSKKDKEASTTSAASTTGSEHLEGEPPIDKKVKKGKKGGLPAGDKLPAMMTSPEKQATWKQLQRDLDAENCPPGIKAHYENMQKMLARNHDATGLGKRKQLNAFLELYVKSKLQEDYCASAFINN